MSALVHRLLFVATLTWAAVAIVLWNVTVENRAPGTSWRPGPLDPYLVAAASGSTALAAGCLLAWVVALVTHASVKREGGDR